MRFLTRGLEAKQTNGVVIRLTPILSIVVENFAIGRQRGVDGLEPASLDGDSDKLFDFTVGCKGHGEFPAKVQLINLDLKQCVEGAARNHRDPYRQYRCAIRRAKQLDVDGGDLAIALSLVLVLGLKWRSKCRRNRCKQRDNRSHSSYVYWGRHMEQEYSFTGTHCLQPSSIHA